MSTKYRCQSTKICISDLRFGCGVCFKGSYWSTVIFPVQSLNVASFKHKKDIICGIQMMFVFALYLRLSRFQSYNSNNSDFSVK